MSCDDSFLSIDRSFSSNTPAVRILDEKAIGPNEDAALHVILQDSKEENDNTNVNDDDDVFDNESFEDVGSTDQMNFVPSHIQSTYRHEHSLTILAHKLQQDHIHRNHFHSANKNPANRIHPSLSSLSRKGIPSSNDREHFDPNKLQTLMNRRRELLQRSDHLRYARWKLLEPTSTAIAPSLIVSSLQMSPTLHGISTAVTETTSETVETFTTTYPTVVSPTLTHNDEGTTNSSQDHSSCSEDYEWVSIHSHGHQESLTSQQLENPVHPRNQQPPIAVQNLREERIDMIYKKAKMFSTIKNTQLSNDGRWALKKLMDRYSSLEFDSKQDQDCTSLGTSRSYSCHVVNDSVERYPRESNPILDPKSSKDTVTTLPNSNVNPIDMGGQDPYVSFLHQFFPNENIIMDTRTSVDNQTQHSTSILSSQGEECDDHNYLLQLGKLMLPTTTMTNKCAHTRNETTTQVVGKQKNRDNQYHRTLEGDDLSTLSSPSEHRKEALSHSVSSLDCFHCSPRRHNYFTWNSQKGNRWIMNSSRSTKFHRHAVIIVLFLFIVIVFSPWENLVDHQILTSHRIVHLKELYYATKQALQVEASLTSLLGRNDWISHMSSVLHENWTYDWIKENFMVPLENFTCKHFQCDRILRVTLEIYTDMHHIILDSRIWLHHRISSLLHNHELKDQSYSPSNLGQEAALNSTRIIEGRIETVSCISPPFHRAIIIPVRRKILGPVCDCLSSSCEDTQMLGDNHYPTKDVDEHVHQYTELILSNFWKTNTLGAPFMFTTHWGRDNTSGKEKLNRKNSKYMPVFSAEESQLYEYHPVSKVDPAAHETELLIFSETVSTDEMFDEPVMDFASKIIKQLLKTNI